LRPRRIITPENLASLAVTSGQRPRLISPLSLAGLSLSVGIVLVLLYPHQRLTEQIGKEIKVDEISLQYIKNLLATEPDNHELRLQLAHAYASIGQYTNTFATLQPLYSNREAKWREEAWLYKLDIMLKIAYSTAPGSPERTLKLSQFHHELRVSESKFSHHDTIRKLIRLTETGGENQLAENIAARQIMNSDKLYDFDEAARLALANGRYFESAQIIWRARQNTLDPDQKKMYLKLALTTLQAGGIGPLGLEWVKQLPESEWQSSDMLHILTKLALSSNQPTEAALLATKLIGLDRPNVEPHPFSAHYYDLAFTAFLGVSDLKHALQLAQNAVSQKPDNTLWRERLAHTSEWSGQPQLAIVQWRWLAQHRGDASDWQAWMRLAVDLFDYDAQVTGLERDWVQHGEAQKYARKIVQLYEQLGQPQDALTWLERYADPVKHPELLLISAELLTRMGRESDAIKLYRRYLNRHHPDPDLAVTIAGLYQRAGLYPEAFDVLKISRPTAKPDHKLFWTNFGELAWILKKNEDGILAFRHLSDAPGAETSQQLRLIQFIKQNDPHLAAQTAEQYWEKTGQVDLFITAAEAYSIQSDWQSVKRLYKLAHSTQRQDYENHPRFVPIRAEMHAKLGNLAAAEHDYHLLIARYPADSSFKEAYLWLLIDSRQLNKLDVSIQKWSKLLSRTSKLIDVFAAGHLALSRPDKALELYERIEKSHTQDVLWQLNFASTLEAVGQTKRADKIRKKIWQKHSSKMTSADWMNTRANTHEIEALRLLLLNDPTLGQGVLWKLLRDGSPELNQNSQFIELAAVWLNDHEQNDASRAWLIRRYAHRIIPAP